MADGDLEVRGAWERYVGRTPTATCWFESVVSRHRWDHAATTGATVLDAAVGRGVIWRRSQRSQTAWTA